MSESGYRDAREAARARVETLEHDLAAHDAQKIEPAPLPTNAFSIERRRVRAELVLLEKRRRIWWWPAGVAFSAALRQIAYWYSPQLFYQSHGSPGRALFLVGLCLLFVFKARRPGRKERALERDVADVVRHENEWDETNVPPERRLRVETHAAERAKILEELEQAKELAEAEQLRTR